VARDLLFTFGDLLKRVSPPVDKIVHPGSRLGDRRQQSFSISRIKIARRRPMQDALSTPCNWWRPGDGYGLLFAACRDL
jgi:hypothetical protein